MTELTFLSATEAGRRMRRGVLSSERLVAACLERISRRDGDVGAWAHLNPAQALDDARAADRARRDGAPTGPLHGIPVGIKDIIDTAHLPTENGTAIFAGRRPLRDAEVVRRLKAAGAVILGKTVTTELAFFGPGKTRNPRDLTRTPGGSSSGSAAAVADSHVALALGSQTAGSILRPASYCGVIGYKPTFGAVPLDGVLAQSPPLDTLGGYARDVDDMALLVSVLSGRELSVDRPSRAPRLAFVKSPAWQQGDAAMRTAFEDLARRHPSIVMEVGLPAAFDATGGLQRAVQFRDIARNYGPLADANPGVVSAKLAEVIAEGRMVSDAEYTAACSRRDALAAALEPVLSTYDAILTPAAPGIAPAGLSSTGSPMFNFLWTYLGVPAISIPLLTVEGLPLGVQLVAARESDSALLGVAAWCVENLA